jgi:hypothetical protein
MKINIDTLKDTFKLGYDDYLASRTKANMIEDMYHNRQYTDEQLTVLADRGQPAETFNIIKLFARQMIGYYSTVINTVKVSPTDQRYITIAGVLSDVVSYVNRTNRFDNVGDKLKLDLMLSGLMVVEKEVVVDTDSNGNPKTDRFGRKVNKILKNYVPSSEVVLDPMSTSADYSDARFIHRFKWMHKDEVKKMFPNKHNKLDAYYNFLNTDESEFTFRHDTQFQGYYHTYDNFLVVHTNIVDDNGQVWSCYWSGDYLLSKKKLPYKDVKFSYNVTKLQDSNNAEYYGVFEEVYQSQNAINQALIQIQMMANTNKVMVQDGAVDDVEEFTKAYQRVNSVIPVNNLNGIKIDNLSGDIQQQYIIIDKAFDRIQRVLGINDSFLGMAFASDSGRKVKLQQNAAIMALRYINNKLELFYMLDGWDTVNLIKQYYRSEQIIRVVDEATGERWVALNKPLQHPVTGEVFYDEVIDEETSEPEKDKYGNILMMPLNDPDTDLEFSDVEIEIDPVSYNDEDEKNQLMLETMLSGNIGNALMTVNPAGYMKAASLSVKSMKSKHSVDIARILDETANMLQPQPQMQENLGSGGQLGGQSANSQQLKLPQNTNEGL